eukprot:5456703-Amphidinium_carterae.1
MLELFQTWSIGCLKLVLGAEDQPWRCADCTPREGGNVIGISPEVSAQSGHSESLAHHEEAS